MSKTYIYALTDPKTHELFYVGKANNPKKRLFNHMMTAKSYLTIPDLYAKIIEISSSGDRPNLLLLEEVDQDKWADAEKKYISFYKGKGYNLLNSTDGGKVFKKECLKNSNELLSKPILQYTLDGVFVKEWPSSRDAARELGLKTRSAMYCSLNTKHKTAHGFVWRYKMNKDYPRKIKVEKRTFTTKPVIQVLPNGDEVKFNSIRAAAIANKLHVTTLSTYISLGKPLHGLYFKKDMQDKRWKNKYGKLNQKLINYSYINLDQENK